MAFVEMAPAYVMLDGPGWTVDQAHAWLVAQAEDFAGQMDPAFVMPDGLALPVTAQDVLKTALDMEFAWGL